MTTKARLVALSLGVVGVCSVVSPRAEAAGFDTPILYTARHQAMGGTAIASVSDPSAGFHNPAGLQGVKGLAFIGDLSLILGKVKATPAADSGNISSKTVVAPFFLLGGAYRVHQWLTLGLAGFPVASGGAEYNYTNSAGASTVDKTEIVFFEATPMLSLNIPQQPWGKLAIGAGYRASFLTFDREQGKVLDLKLKGNNFGGFRVGVQYQPIEWLKLGLVFRNKIAIDAKGDTGTVYGQPATDGSLEFTLPAKLGGGVRFDWHEIGIATDVEYAFQSQNKRPALMGKVSGVEVPGGVPNVFDWTNGVTWRTGFEYRLGQTAPIIPLRIGYIYDTRVTNKSYPSAFGTPPAPTHTLTLGGGYVAEHWQANVAFTRRMGSTHVDEVGTGCQFCGFPGDYKIEMTGIYLDASVDLPM